MTAVQPVWWEWLTAAVTLAAGVTCLRAGTWAGRHSVWVRNLVVVVGAAVAVGAAAGHYPPLREVVGPWLSVPGGEASFACFGAQMLLGVARVDRKGRARRPLLTAATLLVFLLLAVLTSGALVWHYFGQRLRANYPDASGALQQTTGITCAPAAASMLLYRYGIRISEGELAELANTNLLQGTSPYALGRAVDRVARRHRMRGRVRRVDYARAMRLRRSFVAFVKEPGLGGHALCVLAVEGARVLALDPLSGAPETLSRAEFAAGWDRVIVWVEGAG
jgi:Peptidase C39 family